MALDKKQKIVIIGAGPVGALAALYAARRGDDVEVYELRGGKRPLHLNVARKVFVEMKKKGIGHNGLEKT